MHQWVNPHYNQYKHNISPLSYYFTIWSSELFQFTYDYDFYPRDAMLAKALRQQRVRLSVRPSVCLSVTRRYYAQQSESRIVKCTPSDSPMILVSGRRKILKGSPQTNVPNESVVGFSAIFDQYVVISRKRCILDTKLLQDGNSKPYASYQMVSLSMTLSDP